MHDVGYLDFMVGTSSITLLFQILEFWDVQKKDLKGANEVTPVSIHHGLFSKWICTKKMFFLTIFEGFLVHFAAVAAVVSIYVCMYDIGTPDSIAILFRYIARLPFF